MKTPYRERDNRYKLREWYTVKLIKAKGELLIPIPKDIIKAYHIKGGDIAIFEIIDKNTLFVRFVKKTMSSCVGG